jgi:glycine/D-amino acid oxidase-like deaminating enzyme
VVGSSIALELAESGRDVLVLDKGGGAGLGSTSASSAIVRIHYSTYEGIAVSWEAKFGWDRPRMNSSLRLQTTSAVRPAPSMAALSAPRRRSRSAAE